MLVMKGRSKCFIAMCEVNRVNEWNDNETR